MSKYYSREHYNFISEYLKHLTTLSTGSIILLATFLEKLFAQPRWKALIVVSLSGFMFSVIGSVIGYSVLLLPSTLADDPKAEYKTSDVAANIWAGAIIFTWLGFLIGIVCLSIFAIRNFL